MAVAAKGRKQPTGTGVASGAAGVGWGRAEMRSLGELRPHPSNARQHSPAQVGEIGRSLEEYGWTFPILADEGGTIIAGHGRWAGALKLGWTEGPVIVARGWSDARKRAYMIADNKLGLNSAWDEAQLARELEALTQGEGIDPALLGFEAGEIEELLKQLAAAEAPEGFQEYDEGIKTEHECPKCGYRFSGGGSQE